MAVVRKPGITSTMKTMISFGQSHANTLLTSGWGLSQLKQDILDTNSHVFSGKLPLKYLMGFAEDYNKSILNAKQELILIIARSFKNSYIGEVDADLEINKIEWKIRHIVPDDKHKLKLLSRINKSGLNAKIKLAYRMWDLYELPSLRGTSSDIWAIKTTNALETPRFVIIAFQSTTTSEDRTQDITKFTTADINSIRVYLI
ncbi:hypothetical protein GO639_03325 [Staphylococcus aureus]|nr:hypothetical protein [Staphylococcus aureus]